MIANTASLLGSDDKRKIVESEKQRVPNRQVYSKQKLDEIKCVLLNRPNRNNE